ncbi:MAG TPA: hypothetical protein VFQ45_19595, partial [Longimicrobium sp.]|nr:hypothetical protein [Longimicrobium sp.]
PLGRVTVEPHAFVDVDSVGNIAGNVYPAPYWTAAQRRAFAITGGYVALVPPGASASEAAGIGGDLVAVTADTGCVEGVCAGSRVWAWRGGTWTAVRGLEQAYERAVAVSSDGRILVATVDDDEQETRRAYVVRGGNLRRRRELHMVPGTEAVVRDVSAIGWVVGTGTRSGGGLEGQTEGIAWAVGRLYFLSEHLVDEDWRITSAIAVDDEGRIVGTGVHRVTGLSGPILLTPVR